MNGITRERVKWVCKKDRNCLLFSLIQSSLTHWIICSSFSHRNNTLEGRNHWMRRYLSMSARRGNSFLKSIVWNKTCKDNLYQYIQNKKNWGTLFWLGLVLQYRWKDNESVNLRETHFIHNHQLRPIKGRQKITWSHLCL